MWDEKWTNTEYYLNLPHLQPYFHQMSNGSSRYANKDGLPSVPWLMAFVSTSFKKSALLKTMGDGPLQLLWEGTLGVAWSLKNRFVLLTCCFGGESIVIYLYTSSRSKACILWWFCRAAKLVAKNVLRASSRRGVPYCSWICEMGNLGRGQHTGK